MQRLLQLYYIPAFKDEFEVQAVRDLERVAVIAIDALRDDALKGFPFSLLQPLCKGPRIERLLLDIVFEDITMDTKITNSSGKYLLIYS